MLKRTSFNNEDDHFEISLTPLIDTTLVLLIVFIAATPALHYSFKVSLPNGSHNEYNDTSSDVCFAIDQYGRVYNQEKKIIAIHDIPIIITKSLKKNPQMAVVFFADRDATCNTLIECMEAAKRTEVNHVYCKTKKINL
jgi:biopolymer transport protein ExbD